MAAVMLNPSSHMVPMRAKSSGPLGQPTGCLCDDLVYLGDVLRT